METKILINHSKFKLNSNFGSGYGFTNGCMDRAKVPKHPITQKNHLIHAFGIILIFTPLLNLASRKLISASALDP